MRRGVREWIYRRGWGVRTVTSRKNSHLLHKLVLSWLQTRKRNKERERESERERERESKEIFSIFVEKTIHFCLFFSDKATGRQQDATYKCRLQPERERESERERKKRERERERERERKIRLS